MFNSLDYLIIAVFFLVIYWKGVSQYKKYKNINIYAIGTKTFSSPYLISTIMATWISGSMLSLDLTNTYSQGLYYVIPISCMSLAIFFVGFVVAPRVEEFMETSTIAEALGNVYGREIRTIVAILAIFATCAPIAAQFKVMGNVIAYFFSVESDLYKFIIICIIGAVLIGYCWAGGINSVVHTDVLQIVVAIIALASVTYYFLTQDFQWTIDTSLPEYSKYNLSYVLTTYNDDFKSMLVLMFYFAIPSVGATAFQRVVMASSTEQARNSWIISSILTLLIAWLIAFLGWVMLNIDQTIDSQYLLGYIIDIVTPNGIKGLLLIGFLALSMSTADSFLNISAVLFANDLYKTKTRMQSLNIARYSTIFIGIVSICLATIFSGILEIMRYVLDFYMPIVTTLFFFTIFKYRFSKTCCLVSITTTFVFVLTIKILNFTEICKLNSLIPGVVFFIITHILGYFIIDKWKLFQEKPLILK